MSHIYKYHTVIDVDYLLGEGDSCAEGPDSDDSAINIGPDNTRSNGSAIDIGPDNTSSNDVGDIGEREIDTLPMIDYEDVNIDELVGKYFTHSDNTSSNGSAIDIGAQLHKLQRRPDNTSSNDVGDIGSDITSSNGSAIDIGPNNTSSNDVADIGPDNTKLAVTPCRKRSRFQDEFEDPDSDFSPLTGPRLVPPGEGYWSVIAPGRAPEDWIWKPGKCLMFVKDVARPFKKFKKTMSIGTDGTAGS